LCHVTGHIEKKISGPGQVFPVKRDKRFLGGGLLSAVVCGVWGVGCGFFMLVLWGRGVLWLGCGGV